MKIKLAILLLIAVCGLSAFKRVVASSAPLARVREVPTSFPPSSRGGVETITSKQALQGCTEPGRYTVVAFTSDTDPACQKLENNFYRFLSIRRDVAIKKVKIGFQSDTQAMLARHRIDLASVPHVIIFDPRGKVVAQDTGHDKAGLELLNDWMYAELKSHSARMKRLAETGG